MSDFNKIIIMGNLTDDADMQWTNSNTAILRGTVANNYSYKGNDDQWHSRPTYLDFEIWGKKAEYQAERLLKGTKVIISGRLQQEKWTDRNSGQPRSKMKIVVDTVQSFKKMAPEGSNPYQETNQSSRQDPPPPPFPSGPEKDQWNNSRPGAQQTTEVADGSFDVNDDEIDSIPF